MSLAEHFREMARNNAWSNLRLLSACHQLHHRGQVHAMLSGTAIKPPQFDEYFLAEDRPAADAELASCPGSSRASTA